MLTCGMKVYDRCVTSLDKTLTRSLRQLLVQCSPQTYRQLLFIDPWQVPPIDRIAIY